MKIKNLTIIFIIILLFIACNEKEYLSQGLNKEEVIFTWDDFGKLDTLNLNTVFTINTLGICTNFYKFDTLLYFNSSMQTDFAVTITDMQGNIINTTVAVGRGLNEVMSLFFMGQIKDEKMIYCYDGQQYHVVRFYNIDTFMSNKYPNPEKIIDLGVTKNAVLALFNEDLFLTRDVSSNNKVEIVKSDKTVKKRIGQYNLLSINDTNKYYINTAFSKKATIKPDKKKFALSYVKTDVLEIYDTTGKQLFAGHGPDNFNLYDFKPEKEKNIAFYGLTNDKSRYAYRKVQSINNFIIALYSGKIVTEKGPFYESDYILIFDWDGKPYKAYRLSIPASAFYYEEASNTIFVYNTNKETLYKAKLNL